MKQNNFKELNKKIKEYTQKLEDVRAQLTAIEDFIENIENGEEIFIALALLPANIDVGTKIHEEMFEYTVVS